jgi:hypothetical protein
MQACLDWYTFEAYRRQRKQRACQELKESRTEVGTQPGLPWAGAPRPAEPAKTAAIGTLWQPATHQRRTPAGAGRLANALCAIGLYAEDGAGNQTCH